MIIHHKNSAKSPFILQKTKKIHTYNKGKSEKLFLHSKFAVIARKDILYKYEKDFNPYFIGVFSLHCFDLCGLRQK